MNINAPHLVAPANVKVETIKESFAAEAEDFPSIRQSSTTTSANVSPHDSDAETSATTTAPTTKSGPTLANQVALKNNMSVQEGGMAAQDFPTLGGGATLSSNSWGSGARNTKQDDFPSLNGNHTSQGSSRSPLMARSWASSTASGNTSVSKSSKVSHQAYGKKSTPSIQSNADFPSLGSISSILLKPSASSSSSSSSGSSNNKPALSQRSQIEKAAPVPPQQLLSSSSSSSSLNTMDKPNTNWQKVGTATEPAKPKKNKKKGGKESPKTEAQTEDVEDYPSLPPSQPAPSSTSAQFLFGRAKKKVKGHIVDVIPAKTVNNSDVAPVERPKAFKVVEEPWKQVGNGDVPKTTVKMEEVADRPSPTAGIDVVINSNSKKDKSKKKKEPKLNPHNKKEDFPELPLSQTPSETAKPKATVTVGNTWMSEDVKKSIEESEEWKEVPKTKVTPVPNPTKNKKKTPKLTAVVDDEEFPSLGGSSVGKTNASWLKSNDKKQEKPQEEENDSGMTKLKGKKKGKKSPEPSEEEPKEKNNVATRNLEVEALIKEINEIESSSSKRKDKQASSKKEQKREERASDLSSIYKTSGPSILTDDFIASKKAAAPPPGFAAKVPANVPTKVKAPPPGFAKPPPPGLGGLANSQANISPVSTSVPTSNSSSSFLKPPDFDLRNQQLIGNIRLMLQSSSSENNNDDGMRALA